MTSKKPIPVYEVKEFKDDVKEAEFEDYPSNSIAKKDRETLEKGGVLEELIIEGHREKFRYFVLSCVHNNVLFQLYRDGSLFRNTPYGWHFNTYKKINGKTKRDDYRKYSFVFSIPPQKDAEYVIQKHSMSEDDMIFAMELFRKKFKSLGIDLPEIDKDEEKKDLFRVEREKLQATIDARIAEVHYPSAYKKALEIRNEFKGKGSDFEDLLTKEEWLDIFLFWVSNPEGLKTEMAIFLLRNIDPSLIFSFEYLQPSGISILEEKIGCLEKTLTNEQVTDLAILFADPRRVRKKLMNALESHRSEQLRHLVDDPELQYKVEDLDEYRKIIADRYKDHITTEETIFNIISYRLIKSIIHREKWIPDEEIDYGIGVSFVDRSQDDQEVFVSEDGQGEEDQRMTAVNISFNLAESWGSITLDELNISIKDLLSKDAAQVLKKALINEWNKIWKDDSFSEVFKHIEKWRSGEDKSEK